MRVKATRAFAFFAVLLFSQSTFATTLRCDDCSLDQMAAVAVQRADQVSNYTTPVYVINFPADAVVKYGFSRPLSEPDLENGIKGYRYTVANPQPAETAISAYVNYAYQTAKSVVQLDPGHGATLPGSVYQDMTNPSAHLALQNYLNSGSWYDVSQRFLTFLQGLNPFTSFDPSAVSLTLTFKYDDGSWATYRYDPVTKSWDRVKGTERDSHGNIPVVSPTDFTSDGGGERYFNFQGGNDGDLIRFLQTAQMYGISVSGPATRTIIACVTVSGVTTCRSVPI